MVHLRDHSEPRQAVIESIVRVYSPKWKETHSRLLTEVQEEAGRRRWLQKGDWGVSWWMLSSEAFWGHQCEAGAWWALSLSKWQALEYAGQTLVLLKLLKPSAKNCADSWASGDNTYSGTAHLLQGSKPGKKRSRNKGFRADLLGRTDKRLHDLLWVVFADRPPGSPPPHVVAVRACAGGLEIYPHSYQWPSK